VKAKATERRLGAGGNSEKFGELNSKLGAPLLSRHSQFPMAVGENLANSTASPTTQCRSNRSPAAVSGKREYLKELPETFDDFGL
jgi:hypothetical protein